MLLLLIMKTEAGEDADGERDENEVERPGDCDFRTRHKSVRLLLLLLNPLWERGAHHKYLSLSCAIFSHSLLFTLTFSRFFAQIKSNLL